VRQGMRTGQTVRFATFTRPNGGFDLFSNPAIRLDVLAANHNISSRLASRNCRGDIDLPAVLHTT